MHCKCKTVQLLVLCVTKVFVTCVRLQTQPKICQKINSFLVYGKTFIIEVSYSFLYVLNCMELHEKIFPIFENCMISLFGQPGFVIL